MVNYLTNNKYVSVSHLELLKKSGERVSLYLLLYKYYKKESNSSLNKKNG